MLRSDDLRTTHMRLFDRVPLLNPLRPWYQAFFDNVDSFITDVLPQTQCLVTWENTDGLSSCISDLGHTLQIFIGKVVAAENMEYEQDLKEGWSEDGAILSTRIPSPLSTSVYTPSATPITSSLLTPKIDAPLPPPTTTNSLYVYPLTPHVSVFVLRIGNIFGFLTLSLSMLWCALTATRADG